MAVSTKPKSITATGIELFRAGQQTDSQGRSKGWTVADLEEIAAAYNSVAATLHDAPILDQPVAPIQIGHDSEKAYGWLAKVYRQGEVLKGDYTDVNPAFAQMVNDKSYRKRSISLYPPDHGSNPTPGKWNIRHVAYVAIPAVKGLADHEIPVDLADSVEGLWEFSAPYGAVGGLSWLGSIAAFMQTLRDKAIEKDGLEKANADYPQMFVDELKTLGQEELATVRSLFEMRDALERRISDVEKWMFEIQNQNNRNSMGYSEGLNFMDWPMELESAAEEAGMDAKALAKAAKLDPDLIQEIMDGTTEPDEAQGKAILAALKKGKKADPPTDMGETIAGLESQILALSNELKGSRTAIASLQAENGRLLEEQERQQVTSFVEKLVLERKVLPANQQSTIELAMAMPNSQPIEFSEGDEKILATPRDRFLETLKANKPLYSDSSLPTGPADAPYGSTSQDFSAVNGFTVDAESAEVHRKAVAYCQKEGWDYRDADQYTQAVIAVSV